MGVIKFWLLLNVYFKKGSTEHSVAAKVKSEQGEVKRKTTFDINE